jgi:hypothetical protein
MKMAIKDSKKGGPFSPSAACILPKICSTVACQIRAQEIIEYFLISFTTGSTFSLSVNATSSASRRSSAPRLGVQALREGGKPRTERLHTCTKAEAVRRLASRPIGGGHRDC